MYKRTHSTPCGGRADTIRTHLRVDEGSDVSGARRRANDPDRRERILAATLRTVAAHGVHATTHRRIAAEADVPLGSVTYYFTGLEQLLEEAFATLAEVMSVRYHDALDGARDRDEACEAVTDLIVGEHAGPAEMTLIHEMYSFAHHNAVTATLTRTWLLRSHETLRRHFTPASARAIDALVEAWPMHREFERAPLERSLVLTAVRALARAYDDDMPTETYR